MATLERPMLFLGLGLLLVLVALLLLANLPPLDINHHAVIKHGQDAVEAWQTVNGADPNDFEPGDLQGTYECGARTLEVAINEAGQWCLVWHGPDYVGTSFKTSNRQYVERKIRGCRGLGE